MNNSFPISNKEIKKEADEILHQKGLLAILDQFGTPHIHGSYALDLMTWRDLDIYLETNTMTEADFFELGKKIAIKFDPVKMSFRNERIQQTPGLPAGLYWGIYCGNERAGAWKIDTWAINTEECKKLIDHCIAIKNKLTETNRLPILEIKSQCWQDPQYRKSYSSTDIYTAVLEHSVTDIEGFKKYLHNKS